MTYGVVVGQAVLKKIKNRLWPKEKTGGSVSGKIKSLTKLGGEILKGDIKEDSIEELEKLVKLRPNDPNVLTKFANVLTKFGRKEEAIEYYEKAVKLKPENVKYLEMYGVALGRIGRGEEVVEYFERLLDKQPKDRALLQRYYKVLTKIKKWDRADEIATRAINLGPEGDTLFWNKKPLSLFKGGSNDPFLSIDLDPEVLWELEQYFKQRPQDLLKIPGVRARLSRFRRRQMVNKGYLKLKEEDDNIIQNAVVHNVDKLDGSTDDGERPALLINPVVSIDYVLSHIDEMKVLTIGPRSEAEIFALMSAGFKPENITGIDLISYTPLIDHGDMHELPYEDESFDIIIAGWVLAYSNNNPLAAKEILRVCKPKGYIAVGCAYSPPERGPVAIGGKNIDSTRFSTTKDITQHFEDSIERVVFDGEVERERRKGTAAVTVVMQKK